MSGILPGDKVTFINENMAGEVTAIIDGEHVSVLIPEGLEIPVHISQLVKADTEPDYESGAFKAEKESPGQTESARTNTELPEGFLAVFTLLSGTTSYQLGLLNNTAKHLLYNCNEIETGLVRSLAHGTIEPGHIQQLKKLDKKHFDQWPALHVQWFVISKDWHKAGTAESAILKYHAKQFAKKEGKYRIGNNEVVVFKLLSEKPIPAAAYLESIPDLSAKEDIKKSISKPSAEIDLHIEALNENYLLMDPHEILPYQMDCFKIALDRALAHDYDEITFIHGVGNGVLKNKIYSYLQNKKYVRSVEAANPNKYGNGATLVKLKTLRK